MITHLLLAIGIFGLVTSTAYAVLVLLSALRFVRRRRAETESNFTPPVSLLKPLHGIEPDLEEHLESFFRQDYPNFEILFCAREEKDRGLEAARRVAARFPHVPVRFFTSGNPPDGSAKVWSLERMGLAAAHSIFVISDSDVTVTPQYLKSVVASFADSNVGVSTCLYRGVSGRRMGGGSSVWSKLEAVAMSIEMSSGVLVADWLEGMKFALGPTMVVRRRCLEQIGGFRVLRPYHADDYMLGNLAAAKGWQVVLSTHVVSHHVLNSRFLCSMRHQLRWMKSTRFSRPKGHLGTAVTFGMPYALLFAAAALVLHRPWLGAAALTWGLATRCLVAGMVAKYVVDDPTPGQSILLFPLRDFVGFVHWIASYLGSGFQWRGEVYRFHHDGVMRS